MADDLELLRRLRPERAESGYLERGADPTADHLLETTLAVPMQRRRGRRQRRIFVGITVGIVLTGAGATAAVLHSRQPEDPTMVLCYSEPRATESMLAAETPALDIGPMQQCSNKWTDGTFGSDGAPPLVACVTSADLVAVLPGDASTCIENGWTLAEIPAVPQPATVLADALSDRFVDTCLTDQEATASATQVLADLGLTGWQVAAAGDGASGCHYPMSDVGRRLIKIVHD